MPLGSATGWFRGALAFAIRVSVAFAGSFDELCAWRAIVGFGLGGVPVAFSVFMEFLPSGNRGEWLTIIDTFWTLGSVAAAGACARALRLDRERSANALSLGASLASGLTNQGGFGAKAAHAGLAAMQGVVAATLAASGLGASPATLDGPLSLASVMGAYDPDRFAAAFDSLGQDYAIDTPHPPWR